MESKQFRQIMITLLSLETFHEKCLDDVAAQILSDIYFEFRRKWEFDLQQILEEHYDLHIADWFIQVRNKNSLK